MAIAAGNTFILLRATGSVPHLWVVVDGPVHNPPEVVILSLTTLRPHSDKTVILHAGDHPFIQHDTCIEYRDARFVKVAKLEELLQKRQAVQRQDMAPEIVERIRAGLVRSPYTVHAIRDRYEEIYRASQ